MTIVLAGRKTPCNDMAPQLALKGQPEQFAGRGIGFAHDALGVNDDDAARQEIQEVLQAVGQAFLFRQLLHALGTDHRQLTLEFSDPGFEHAVGIGQLARHLVEQGKSLFKTLPACLLYRRRLPQGLAKSI